MTETTAPAGLGARLRQLRLDWNLTQRQLSDSLGLSGALVSSWENGLAVPPEERLNGYALFFATHRSVDGPSPVLVPSADLTADEESARSELIDELVRLREETLNGPAAAPRPTGALGGRFWYFPDGQPITILCTPLSRRQLGYSAESAQKGDLLPTVQYATNPTHPNAVRNLANGDIDALLELVGHIRAENPTSDVRWITYDRITSPDQLTGHLIVLGGGDAAPLLLPTGNVAIIEALRSDMQLPIRTRFDESDDEFGGEFGGEFVVTVDDNGTPDPQGARSENYGPRFQRDESLAERPRVFIRNAPVLISDVALIARRPNPLNPAAKITLLSGVFSRGTYGAVRAFTDARFRSRNEQWLANALSADDFWLLAQVPVLAGENTITPDLSRAAHRLRLSSPKT